MKFFTSNERKYKAMRVAVLIVLLAIIAFAAYHIILSSAWCIENWGVHPRALRCMYYENTAFGRFIQP